MLFACCTGSPKLIIWFRNCGRMKLPSFIYIAACLSHSSVLQVCNSERWLLYLIQCMQASSQTKILLTISGTCQNVEQLWQMVAMHSQAVFQSNDQDVLSECCTWARHGLIFAKRANLQEDAVLFCKSAVQVACTLNSIPVDDDWFQVCMHANLGFELCVCKYQPPDSLGKAVL